MPPSGEHSRRVLAAEARRGPRRAWLGAGIATAIALVIAALADGWYGQLKRDEARVHVRADMVPYADALRGAVERRLGLLAGLRSFAESRSSRAHLDEEFPRFSQGAVSGTFGVRALQFVENGRIVATYPITGNEAVVNYNLRADPRPQIGGDVLRALESGKVTVTGPVRLIQGGTGLLIRQKVAPRKGFPDLAAIILDVPTLLSEAGIPDRRSGLVMEVHNRQHAWFGGDPRGAAVEPETLVVSVVDGDWHLFGAPAEGWESLTAGPQRIFRVAALGFVLAAGLVGFLLGGREDRLRAQALAAGSTLDLALRAGKMGTWVWDLRDNSARWSDSVAKVFGFRAEEVEDPVAVIFGAVHPEDDAEFRRRVMAAANGEADGFMIESRIRRADGTYRWVLAIGELERDEQNAPLRMFGVLTDATERRDLEERLRHSQRLESIGKLAGGVAHDFNNLLAAITGFAELARVRLEERPHPEQGLLLGDLDQVLATATRGASLTQQLLAFSRRSPSVPKPVDLSATVRELAPMLDRLLTSRIIVRAELAEGLPQVHVDPGQLGQVVMNLVVNARDAMPDGGEVILRTVHVPPNGHAPRVDGAPPGEWVALEVEDTGTGMTAEVQARMFEPYFTTKEMGRGTGLGLSVVYGAVENARGVIAVRSAPDRGTTFRVFYPPALLHPSSSIP